MSSIQILTAIASAIAAWIALLLAILNFFTSRRALRISEQQEVRRKPAVVSYLQDGYVATDVDSRTRVYAILVSLSNRSDNNNAVAQNLLLLTYARDSTTQLTVKVDADLDIPDAFRKKSTNHLRVPIRLDAHQTVSGWCFFTVKYEIFRGYAVERIRVMFVDSHGNETIVEPVIIREYRNDVESASNQENSSNSS